MKILIEQAIELNKEDNQARYVFYTEGQWRLGVRLPTLVDFPTFYVVEHRTSHAVVL